MAKKKWMKAAFADAHGQFSAKAKAAGMSTEAYAEKEAHAPGRLGRQARLVLVAQGKNIPGKPKPKSRAASRYRSA